MSVIRVNKTSDYTVMSNHHFKDKRLSLKAKGLLSQMLSLPPDWDYTVAGLSSINQESKTAIQNALKELEATAYLVRTRTKDDKGRFDYIYDIYEEPCHGKPRPENPYTEEPCTENVPQLNTNNKILKDKLLKDKINKVESAKRFTPPKVEEVKEYCSQRNNSIDPEQFVDFYASKGWKIGNNTMKDWKAAVRTWEKREQHNQKPKEDDRWYHSDEPEDDLPF